jgi:hypothetical protein
MQIENIGHFGDGPALQALKKSGAVKRAVATDRDRNFGVRRQGGSGAARSPKSRTMLKVVMEKVELENR